MSKIEVNTVRPQCGTTVTLGGTGETVALGCGASQTGFGRTGTVDWVTGSIKTATFSAVSGNGYFCNTTAGVLTVNLPAGSAGDIVGISDYASTFNTNNLTVTPNGSELINGVNDDYTISTDGLAVSLVYVDATRGWKSVTGSDADATGVSPAWVVATGGTPSTGTIDGDYKIHAFTGTGPLCVSCAGNADGNNKIDYMVIAGGASGGGETGGYGGGGGAGGYRESVPSPAAWTGSPNASPGGGVVASVTNYTITVGGGGAVVPGCNPGTPGDDSVFSTITSAGGGYGGNNSGDGDDGGSGGGGGGGNQPGCNGVGGSGNTPAIACYSQGFDGGKGNIGAQPPNGGLGGGGGGSGAVGVDVAHPSTCTSGGGAGGAGLTSCISGTPVQRGGGGGGGANNHPSDNGGAGGAGGGGKGAPSSAAGTANTGGAGGGGSHGANPPASSSAGGSGIVVVRYKFQ